MLEVAKKTKMNVKSTAKHQFEPIGASCVLILAESHFACHTWPELSMATFTVHTCAGAGQAISAVRAFMQAMNTNIVKMVEFEH